jgi:hypothetical protein
MDDERTETDLKLPEEPVEDLEPTDEDSQDVQGGKYSDIVLKKGTTTD